MFRRQDNRILENQESRRRCDASSPTAGKIAGSERGFGLAVTKAIAFGKGNYFLSFWVFGLDKLAVAC